MAKSQRMVVMDKLSSSAIWLVSGDLPMDGIAYDEQTRAMVDEAVVELVKCDENLWTKRIGMARMCVERLGGFRMSEVHLI